MPLTPQDVKSKTFSSTRLSRGYSEGEVDAFLDEVEAELTRLLTENAELRRQLGTGQPAPAASVPGGPPPTGSVVLPAGAPSREPAAVPGPPGHPGSPAASAAPAPLPPPTETEELMRRTLVLAQRTADEAVREARAEAGRVTEEARLRVAAQLGALEDTKSRLQTEIEQLRGFEREYRTRLRAYLEMQLRDLDTAGAVAPPRPAVPATPAPPAGLPPAAAPLSGAAAPAAAAPAPAAAPTGVGRAEAVLPGTPAAPGRTPPPPVGQPAAARPADLPLHDEF
jgi:DivIVA domain-containing protein